MYKKTHNLLPDAQFRIKSIKRKHTYKKDSKDT